MQKAIAILFCLTSMVFIGGCGGSSTAPATVYSVPVPIAKPYPTTLGGSIQRPVSFHNYSVTTFAGSSAGFNNISSAGSATFNRPIAITTDGVNLYVADSYNNAIRQINISTQHVTTIAGNVAGLAGSTDGAGTAASFNRPNGITIDEHNNLYVTDSGNYTIRKIDLSTGVVTTLAGTVGVPGSVDSTTVGTNARFNVLNGITTDGNNLYVTDSNNTVRMIALSTTTVPSGPVSTLAGTPGSTGSADGDLAAARFFQPARITTDGANLYVADFGNSTIRMIKIETGKVSTIAGKVEPGGASGAHADSTLADPTGQSARFNQPNGITCDGTNLYVTDSYDNTIRKIVLSPLSPLGFSGPVTTIAGTTGVAGSTDAKGTAATFNTPIGITTDGISLYITDIDNHRIRRIH